MKVVLFCGGFGMRMREYSDSLPKPMVPIGSHPILWHLMKYYAHYGHRDFVLCLGYKGDVIKEYFLKYDEWLSKDFASAKGGRKLERLPADIGDWNITFVDTGLHANIGQRLKAVEKHLEGEDTFLANYADGLSDVPLPEMIADPRRAGKVASFVAVPPNAAFHLVEMDEAGVVRSLRHVAECGQLVNGGFFVFTREIFDYLGPGEDLVCEPFQRLIARGLLVAYPYRGFWACMDTAKEMEQLEHLHGRGAAPWAVWNGTGHPETHAAASL